MAIPDPPNSPPSLTTTYQSTTNAPFTRSITLPSLSSNPTTKDKTVYLSALRKAVTETQEKVNNELTARMEDDKAKVLDGKVHTMADEVKEEETYGEEVVEED